MLKQLTHVNQWVHDQDEALAFYTEKLGLELRDDARPGPDMRAHGMGAAGYSTFGEDSSVSRI